MDGRRFALYFAPEDGTALAEFGWEWLGRLPQSTDLRPLPPLQADMVADARRYGFHATLKPPFRLAEGITVDALVAAVEAFARQRRPFTEPPFRLDQLDGFLAMLPSVPSAAIAELAADCVRGLDCFRAPADADERRKRLSAPLSERQREMVAAWGYPYVLDQFRFHLTLTRRLDAAESDTVRNVVAQRAALALAEPVVFRSLCLFEQPGAGQPFTVSARFPFGG